MRVNIFLKGHQWSGPFSPFSLPCQARSGSFHIVSAEMSLPGLVATHTVREPPFRALTPQPLPQRLCLPGAGNCKVPPLAKTQATPAGKSRGAPHRPYLVSMYSQNLIHSLVPSAAPEHQLHPSFIPAHISCGTHTPSTPNLPQLITESQTSTPEGTPC